MKENRHLISETAKMLGIEPHVLRYWEEELELTIHRNEQGHRYYTDDDLRVLRRVHELKEEGVQLKALKVLVPQLYADKPLDLCSIAKVKPADHQRKAVGNALAESKGKVNSLAYSKMQSSRESGVRAGKEQREHESAVLVGKEQSSRENGAQAEKEQGGHENAVLARKETTVENRNTEVAERKSQGVLYNEHKLAQFQEIMNLAVSKALSEQQKAIGEAVGSCVSEEVSERVSDKVLKQMDYLMRESDDQAEKRYQKLDETIREVQKARMEAAATVHKKKGLFHKKEKSNRVE